MTAGTALVTGGAGFIGSHLVERLVAEDLAVRVLDDFSSGRKENLAAVADAVEIVEGDVADADLVAEAAAGAEMLFHLAARPSVVESVADPLGSHRVNCTGTLAALEAARRAGVRRFVFASSCAVYGDGAPLPAREDAPAEPGSPYAHQKHAGEGYARLYHGLYALETAVLRFFNVYGPRQDPRSDYAAVVPRFVAAALAGEAVRIYGDGEQTRDFVYVGDVAEACLAAARVPDPGGVLANVASGVPTSVNALRGAVAEVAGAPLEARGEPARAGEIRHSAADVSRAAERLGWRSRVTLERGLRLTLEAERRARPAGTTEEVES